MDHINLQNLYEAYGQVYSDESSINEAGAVLPGYAAAAKQRATVAPNSGKRINPPSYKIAPNATGYAGSRVGAPVQKTFATTPTPTVNSQAPKPVATRPTSVVRPTPVAKPQASKPISTPAIKPTAPKPTAASNSSSANATTQQKIQGGTSVYKSQIKVGDVKGAEATGKSTWALANPSLANRPKTPNPLMNRPIPTKESVDAYDIILDHLLDEGYVNSVESALAIMTNMSEAWKSSIVDNYTTQEA